jgi:hypothetical protein
MWPSDEWSMENIQCQMSISADVRPSHKSRVRIGRVTIAHDPAAGVIGHVITIVPLKLYANFWLVNRRSE